LSALLKDSAIHSSGIAVPDRVIVLDVFGKLKIVDVDAKVVEVAKSKQKELPVILILPSIEKC
jgi:hypothetical protein